MNRLLTGVYLAIDAATVFYLTFLDGYIYTAWNWIFAIPANIFLGTIWPIYWGILHWFG